MKIEWVRAHYLRLADVQAVGDGSQDALLIQIGAGGFEGWGECESSPLPTIAALVAPISHSACRPVLDTVLGAEIDGPSSIRALHARVRMNGMDLLQTDHALSGIDCALWDLLGKRERAPAWSFWASEAKPKTAYASQLFGDTPEATFAAAVRLQSSNFKAAKFGWGPIGQGSAGDDEEHFVAAKEGLGGRALLVDTGCVFGHDVAGAAQRIGALERAGVGWWEEPFMSGGLDEYAALAGMTSIPLAGGEGCHNADQAKHLIRYGKVGFVQIDAGRIGGLTPARGVAEYAREHGVAFVNHTFTSNLALSASLQPYAEFEGYAEVPVETSDLARAIAGDPWAPDCQGFIYPSDNPGLGVEIDPRRFAEYEFPVEILSQGQRLWPMGG